MFSRKISFYRAVKQTQMTKRGETERKENPMKRKQQQQRRRRRNTTQRNFRNEYYEICTV